MKPPSMKELETKQVHQHNIIATGGKKEEAIKNRPFRSKEMKNPEFTDRSYD